MEDHLNTSVKIDFQIGNSESRQVDGPGKLPNITRYMALSIEYNKLLDKGYTIRDIAKFEQVNESWVLRVVKMIFFSPTIQEKILLLPRTKRATTYLSAKQLLNLVKIIDFEGQEAMLMRIWR